MKTRLFKLSAFALFIIFFISCCKDCNEIDKNETKEIAEKINTELTERYKAFSDIVLPVTLGFETDNIRQHLHIEGGIKTPFLILGSFKSKDNGDKTCNINYLNLEIIPINKKGGKLNYKFESGSATAVKSGLDLKVSVRVNLDPIELDPNNPPNSIEVKIDPSAKKVKLHQVLDMTVQLDSSIPTITTDKIYDIQFDCCIPVICKTKIYF